MTESSVVLVGAEVEENLSIRYLAAAVEGAGFDVSIIPFNRADDSRRVLSDVCAVNSRVVGVSVPFQLRARELLELTSDLRTAGYVGHISLGGHFATFEYANIMRDFPAVDSIVRHEGEAAFRDICETVRDGLAVERVAGVVSRVNGGVSVGEKRRVGSLDELAFPSRPVRPDQVLGVPCAPILGSRGCHAHCTFCCIHAYTQNARGPRYRRRSPEDIVREMSLEHSERGVRLFVFHDDNFLVPSLNANLMRYSHMSRLLRRSGLDDIGLVVKCRPDDLHPELIELLQSMGVIRAYVGVETNSSEGIVSLNRGISPDGNRRAIEELRDAGLFHSFNVLIFDPEATLSGVEQNVDFMEEFADIPFNFCRAEVYAGTPLKEILERDNRLIGTYLAWGYEMRDPRVELLFRIVSTAFAPRNFKPDGVANLNMGIRFDNEVLSHFYSRTTDPDWDDQVIGLSRSIGQDSVEALRRAMWFVRHVDPYDHDSAREFTLELSRSIAASDLAFVAEIKAARREVEERVARLLEVDGTRSPALSGLEGRAIADERPPAPVGR